MSTNDILKLQSELELLQDRINDLTTGGKKYRRNIITLPDVCISCSRFFKLFKWRIFDNKKTKSKFLVFQFSWLIFSVMLKPPKPERKKKTSTKRVSSTWFQ